MVAGWDTAPLRMRVTSLLWAMFGQLRTELIGFLGWSLVHPGCHGPFMQRRRTMISSGLWEAVIGV